MNVTFCGPSMAVSSTALIQNVALVWLAGMVTLAGSFASVVSLLWRLTMRSETGGTATVTVPVAACAPAFSLKP